MASRKPRWYCPACGAMYTSTGFGVITCQVCGGLGLRGCARRPVRVSCPVGGCDFTGWDDGGVNDDLGRHRHLSGHVGQPMADLYGALKTARERLCLAQPHVAPLHRQWLQDAINHIDQLGVFYAPDRWSKYDEPQMPASDA